MNLIQTFSPQNIQLGRQLLSDRYSSPEESLVDHKPISQFFEAIDIFERTWDLIESGQTSYYNFSTHSFEFSGDVDPKEELTNRDRAKRDYLVAQIKCLAKRMLTKEVASNVKAVEDLFLHKLLKEGPHHLAKDFISSGSSYQVKGQNSLFKLLNKIFQGTFKSVAQKEAKKSTEFKNNEAKDTGGVKINLIEEDRQDIKDADRLADLIEKSCSAIKAHDVHSLKGKAQKERLLKELDGLSRAIEEKKSVGGLITEELSSTDIINILPDVVFEEIKTIKEILQLQTKKIEEIGSSIRLPPQEKPGSARTAKEPNGRPHRKKDKVYSSKLNGLFHSMKCFFQRILKWFKRLWNRGL